MPCISSGRKFWKLAPRNSSTRYPVVACDGGRHVGEAAGVSSMKMTSKLRSTTPRNRASLRFRASLSRMWSATSCSRFTFSSSSFFFMVLILSASPNENRRICRPTANFKCRGRDEIDGEHRIGPEHEYERADDDKRTGRGIETRRPHAPVEREDHDDEYRQKRRRGAHGRGDHHREIIKEDEIDQQAGNATAHMTARTARSSAGESTRVPRNSREKTRNRNICMKI